MNVNIITIIECVSPSLQNVKRKSVEIIVITDYSSFFMLSLFFIGMTPITFSLMSEICVLTCPTTSSTAAWWKEMRIFNDER